MYGTNVTEDGQSYFDIITLTAGTWLIVLNYASNAQLIVTKGSSITGVNMFGDVSNCGGVVLAKLAYQTTIQGFVNTDDTSPRTYYRFRATAIQIG